jgi:S1-C subfamily serine protease
MSMGSRRAILVFLLIGVGVGIFVAARLFLPGGGPTGVVSGQRDPGGDGQAAPTAGALPESPAAKAPPSAFPPGMRHPFFHARFEPVRNASGTPLGVRVLSVHPTGKLARLGIRAGDIIRSVNRVQLDDHATFDRAVAMAEEAFLTDTSFYVRIKRGDDTFALASMGTVDPKATSPLGSDGQSE